MPTFHVTTEETHAYRYTVEAATPEDAAQLVTNGDVDSDQRLEHIETTITSVEADRTHADYWVDVHGVDLARWRRARRTTHYCSNQRLPSGHPERCSSTNSDDPAIAIGDRYFDTGEAIAQWRTAKLCPTCANRPTER